MTSIASQVRLPPSPELRGISIPTNHHDEGNSRLQSIARYESFHPQALACSPPLQEATSYESGSDPNFLPAFGSHAARRRPTTNNTQHPSQSSHRTTTTNTSLGAISGSDGVALFRISKPHVPLMILSHAATNSTTTGTSAAVTSLAFSPAASRSSLYLASARGSGVLVWDVSGHSLSPLQGRLGVEHSPDSSAITSLTWTGETWLAATTAASACLWDLRQKPAANSFRPSLRFGVASSPPSSTTMTTPYRQIACSDRDECAILDAAGTMRIFDTRMTDRVTRMSTGCLYQFDACAHAGVGLSFLPLTSRSEHCWVTWGLDAPNADAVVKVWMSGGGGGGGAPDESSSRDGGAASTPDDYWYLDTSPDRPKSHKSFPSSKDSIGYRLVGQCTTRNLACARVCPAPVEDSIVTVGLNPKESNAGWRADLWKLKFNELNDDGFFEESKLERIVTFQGDSDTDTSLRSIVGSNPRLRSLRASELAISSYSGLSVESNECGLLLCCLTENGYVTTHAIHEALSGDHASRKVYGADTARMVPALAQTTKIFPSDSDVVIKDAARTWGKLADSLLAAAAIERNPVFDRRDTTSFFGANIGTTAHSIGAEGGGMPFDMDVPVAYSLANAGFTSIGKGDLTSPNFASAIDSTEDSNQADNDVRDAAILMERTETDRIPCPRLCGATFCPGVGGLAAFHNGNVKRMWRRWERSDPARFAAVPGLIGEPSLADPKKQESSGYMGVTDEGTSVSMVSTAECPRTLKDLLAMTGAAKEAEWGEQDESGASSTGFPALVNNFFEDDSEGSSDSGEEQSEEIAETPGSKNQKRMYDNYFSGYQRPLVEPLTRSQGTLDQTENEDVAADGVFSPTVGSASEMLSPLVKVSHAYDQIALNNQSPELAAGWKLGDFNFDRVHFRVNAGGAHVRDVSREHHNGFPEQSSAFRGDRDVADVAVSSRSLSKRDLSTTVLPSYRSLLPPSNEPRNEVQRTSIHVEDERGVHGGEYSVRPNMQESMVFLRKLFTHQHQDGGKASFPNLLSPPDSPMLPNKLKPGRKLGSAPSVAQGRLENAQNESGTEPLHLGVYTKRADISNEDEELERMEELCSFNADVCKSLGEKSKMETWKLVAKVIRNRIENSGHGFDGWGGAGGGALGVSLVGNLLRFYESLGDVQMLSTLVCVLRIKRQERKIGKGHGWYLLPPDTDARYDLYIRRYADLLYGWGLLTIRAELNKHLVRTMSPVDSGLVEVTDRIDESVSSAGIALVFKCPRCAEISEFDNRCRSCNDYAFRCAICDNAVRGLFTVCGSCGHGGHVTHMSEWFASQNDECPSGCGCNCRLAAMLQRESDLQGPLNVLQPEQMEQQVAYVVS